MKASRIVSGLFFLIILTAAANAQQQLTQTVTAQNKNCNATCSVIDIPALNNNPAAVVFITPAGGTPNPHPIGAYYMYLNKWSVFNLDAVALPDGAKFSVEYYANSDANHFIYVVPQRVNAADPAYIDHAGLNNNPNVEIRIFPYVSGSVGNHWNKLDVKVEYDPAASKWSVANVNNTPIPKDAAYNIMFSNRYSAANDNANKILNTTPKTPISNSPIKNGSITPETISSSCNCVIPTSLPPNGNASGDLSGTYPNPTVKGLQGKPLSSDPPAVGQILKWNGSAWEPANESSTGSSSAYNAGTGLAIQGNTIYANNIAPLWNANKLSGNSISNTPPTIGQVLKWNGTVWAPANEVGASASATPSPTPVTAPASAMQTFFKNSNGSLSPKIPGNAPYTISDLTHSIVLNKKSRLIINEITRIISPFCLDIGCNGTSGYFDLNINGSLKVRIYFKVDANSYFYININNFMVDLDPGTYSVTFVVSHSPAEGIMQTDAVQSSIMVIPLE